MLLVLFCFAILRVATIWQFMNTPRGAIRCTDHGHWNLRGNPIVSIHSTVGRAICLTALLALAACSSTGKTSVKSYKSGAIPNTATAALAVTADLKKDHRYKQRAIETIQKQLTDGLVSGGIFRSVSAAPASADYKLNVRINRVRVVTPGGRVMLGFMAGRNNVRVDVSVRNAVSGAVVRSFETTGYGASMGWGSQSYGVDDPVREVVKRVIENLK